MNIIGEEEFLSAMQSFIPSNVNEEYRAYYDENNWITGFAGSGFPDGDNWVTITRELYITHNWSNLRLIDDKIIYVAPVYMHYFQLTKSTKGIKIVRGHAGIVLEELDTYQDIEYYDTNR
jgi:hypothetical protein